MKCEHCGGNIIYDQGCFGSPAELKCISCGRRSGPEGREIMDEIEKKKCEKCGKEFPLTAEFFHRSACEPGGFVDWCKPCRNEQQSDWRVKNKRGKKAADLPPVPKRLAGRQKGINVKAKALSYPAPCTRGGYRPCSPQGHGR